MKYFKGRWGGGGEAVKLSHIYQCLHMLICIRYSHNRSVCVYEWMQAFVCLQTCSLVCQAFLIYHCPFICLPTYLSSCLYAHLIMELWQNWPSQIIDMTSKHPAGTEYFIYFLKVDLVFSQLHVVCWKHIQEAERVAEENSFISCLV